MHATAVFFQFPFPGVIENAMFFQFPFPGAIENAVVFKFPFPGVIEKAVFFNSFSSACAKCCVFPVPFLFPSSLPVPFPGIWECQYFGDNIGVFRCRYHNFSLVQPAPPCMCGTSAVCFLLDIFDN